MTPNFYDHRIVIWDNKKQAILGDNKEDPGKIFQRSFQEILTIGNVKRKIDSN